LVAFKREVSHSHGTTYLLAADLRLDDDPLLAGAVAFWYGKHSAAKAGLLRMQGIVCGQRGAGRWFPLGRTPSRQFGWRIGVL